MPECESLERRSFFLHSLSTSISRNMSGAIPFTIIFMVVFLSVKRCRKDFSLQSVHFKLVPWLLYSQTHVVFIQNVSAFACRFRFSDYTSMRYRFCCLLQFLTETCVFRKALLCVSLNTCDRQSSQNTVISVFKLDFFFSIFTLMTWPK